MAEHKDGLRASISRWASQDRDEARELRKDRRKAGLVAISDAPDRQRVIVQGTLKTVTLRNKRGYFDIKMSFPSSGQVKIQWQGDTSRTQNIRVR